MDQTVCPMHIGNLGHLTATGPKGTLRQLENTVKPFPAQGKSLGKGLPEGLSGKLLHEDCPGRCQHFSLPLAEAETQSDHAGKIKIFHSFGEYPERLLPNHLLFLTINSELFKG